MKIKENAHGVRSENMIKRKLSLVLIDIFIAIGVYALLFAFKYATTEEIFWERALVYLYNFLITVPCLMFARFALNVYTSLWRYANAESYLRVVLADMIGGSVAICACYFLQVPYLGIGAGCALTAVACVAALSARFCYQLLYRHHNAKEQAGDGIRKPVAIVGAGKTGTLLAEELICSPLYKYRPVCFVDVSREKVGSRVGGIPVFSPDANLFAKLKGEGVEDVLFAMPQLPAERFKELYEYYTREGGFKVKTYDFPSALSLEGIEPGKRVLKEVEIEDLLFRDPLKITTEDAKNFYTGKVVLVTGGGGSIGSEICRQIAKRSPKMLIVFDIYENNAYAIEQELKARYGDNLNLCVEIGSVRDRDRLEAVFANYRPEVVFHAAAHKHVPLMEHSCCEAIKNNVFGTRNTADMAEKYGVERFVLISTDKAVNPTNVMGASKRLCEMVIQCRRDSKTVFAAVRFGNVLGSNGSVIPLFKRQLAAGGPLTVTDKRVVRYFMTIPEASQLVLEAGAMAKDGELFVLDMGKPVRVLELAENMIRLSGLRPYIDVDIVEIGLRPGEKLYEELLIRTEELDRTNNQMIFVERDMPLTREQMDGNLTLLAQTVESEKNTLESEKIRQVIRQIVPTYRPPEEVNREAEKAREMQIAK